MDTGRKRLPKSMQVKNKTPADIQITAEQLLREAKERELEIVPPPPKQKISDPEELESYKLRKRKTFEDSIRKNRNSLTNWIKYAQFEESQQEIQRARSIYERGLDVDHRGVTLWLKYAEMEMKNKQINHARNLWDRAVSLLPRMNQFWYKYVYMEEMLGNIPRARQIFERWMEWHPDEQAWATYINFEKRHGESQKIRDIFERFSMVHPEINNWIKYAKYEEYNVNSSESGKAGAIARARAIYERALNFFGDQNLNSRLCIEFAKFEERCKEHERVRVIYKYALETLPKDECQDLYKAYSIHEKKYGDRQAIEDVVTNKRKLKYEEEISTDPLNYDAWFDLLRLLESEGEVEIIRDNYERAIANIPPIEEKRYWKRYIYLWIYYALFEELEMRDMERTRQIYKTCLKFEIRQKNLTTARKILGHAIGMCPKDKLFRSYVDTEIQLRQFDRARTLYAKWLEYNPCNVLTWVKFADLETILGDLDRARYLFDLATELSKLDMPEILWKAYIDFELEQEEYDRVRTLYDRLLSRTNHVKVWISLGEFEMSVQTEMKDGSPSNFNRARDVYQKANQILAKSETDKEERVTLLEAWKKMELQCGDPEKIKNVEKLMPQRIKKRRRIINETTGEETPGWEEYFDYVFESDETQKPNLKLLALAKRWKKSDDTVPNVNDGNDTQ
ncbi:unnamed protein product [Gordionus sp. m RMFG-2023]